MRRKYPKECGCLSVPVGDTVPANPVLDSHLRSLYLGNDFWVEIGCSICPLTGVVWRSMYGDDDERYPRIVYQRTSVLQTELPNYTLCKTTVSLYSNPQERLERMVGTYVPHPDELPPPPFPTLPLEGLIWDSFHPTAEVAWAVDEISVRGQITLFLWLYLPQPLEAGTTVQGWLASPLEAITAQVLVPGFLLEWRWYGGTIGELVVEVQERVLASQYHQYFGFDRPHRDLVEESSEILRSARQGRSRRRK